MSYDPASCPPVASRKLTLVVTGEALPVAFGHKRDTFWGLKPIKVFGSRGSNGRR